MSIIRTNTAAKGGITAEEKIALAAHAQKWIANAMSTEPVDRDRLTAAIKRLYAVSGLAEPRVVIVASPRIMAFAGGLASGIWYLRKNTATRIATSAATRIATDVATDVATSAATRAATSDATYDATYDATSAATSDATYDATYDATSAATDDATYVATYVATYDATYDATRIATEAATRAATRAATSDATSVATRAATDAATDDATDDATRVATRAATYVATRDATTRAATRIATEAATRDAIGKIGIIGLVDEFSRFYGVSREFFFGCIKNWFRPYQGGNMWSAYPCYLSAFRDVLGLDLPVYAKYEAWEACAIEGGYRWMHDEFCIVCDRPEILNVDPQNRPHSDNGPSHRWRDGWSLWHWHGVKVPQFVVEAPETITIEHIAAEENAEVRRVMIERMGYEKYLADARLELIDSCADDHDIVGLRTAKLWRGQDDVILLDMLNSTPEPDGSIKRYVSAIDSEAYNGRAGRECLAAMASTWRRPSDMSLYFARPEDYAPVAES